mmetsp:Transcript_53585/g.117322  ORF Transcript_53585/g.117322 Transcript_53585/m.117322 type:complete len:325 (+) Transcript_53585:129-1103(+)
MGSCYTRSAAQPSEVGAPRPRPELENEEEVRAAEHLRDLQEGRLVSKSMTLSSGEMLSSDRLMKTSGSFVKVVNSQALFYKSDQTIIIFDWDDTICPSSAVRRYARFDRNGKLLTKVDDVMQERLLQLQDQARALLELANDLGKVVLVTNAKRPWVDISCNAFLPGLRDIMRTIPKIYAVELLQQGGEAGMTGNMILTETKTRAMRAAVTEFYSRYPNQSWKNIVSIGDALFEHHAIRQVVEEHMRSNSNAKKCRTKTLKLLDGPTVSGLAIQLRIVFMWLKKMVEADDHVDIDFSADEASINAWRAAFSSEAEFGSESWEPAP